MQHCERWLVCCLLVGLGAPGCDREPAGSGASNLESSLPVVVEQAERGPFRIAGRYTGRVEPSRAIALSVREPGEVIAVSASRDSSRVRAGQLLIELRSRDLELEIEEAELQRQLAERELERERSLLEVGLRAQRQLDERQNALDIVRSRLARLKLRRSQLRIQAPAAGLLLYEKLPAVGQWCASGHPIARIVDPGSLVIEVVVPESWEQAERISHGVAQLPGDEAVALGVASLGAEVAADRGGRVLTLVPQAADSARLLAGASLAVDLILAARDDAVSVPVEALVEADDGSFYVLLGPAVGERGRVRRASVVPGPSNGRRVVIEQGVAGGDWVVIASEYQRQGYYATHLGVGR